MKFKNLNRPSEVRDPSPNPSGGKGEGDMTKERGLEKDAQQERGDANRGGICHYQLEKKS